MKQREDINQEIIDTKATFGSEHGKRVLERMKKKARFHIGTKPKKADGDICTNELLWQMAQRSLILYIINTMKKEPK